MPTASRNERRKRRVRRNLTLATRAYRTEAIARAKVQTILLAILAKNGGEIELTQEGINSAVKSLGKAQYVVEKVEYDKDGLPAEGLFAVRLVTGDETTTAPVFVEEPAQAPVEVEVEPVHVQLATVLGDTEESL